MWLKAILGLVLACTAVVCGVFYWRAPERVGRRAVARWNGKAPFVCDHEDMSIRGLRGHATEGAAFVADHCDIDLYDADLRGPKALSVTGHSHVMLHDSIVTGCVAVRVTAFSEVHYGKGARIEGRADTTGFGQATWEPGHVANWRAPPTLDGVPCPPNTDAYESWAEHACDGVTECYRQHNVLGAVFGNLRVQIAPDGSALEAQFDGEVAAPVRECIVQIGMRQRIGNFDAPGGHLVCSFAGTLGPNGTEQMDRKTTFVP